MSPSLSCNGPTQRQIPLQPQKGTEQKNKFCYPWCRRTTNASLAATNLAHCWPLLVTVLTQYSSNDRIAEKTGRAIKQALQSSKTASAAMLPQVVETVAQQFQQSRQPCMLYIASELLKAYGADQQFQAPLGDPLLSAFACFRKHYTPTQSTIYDIPCLHAAYGYKLHLPAFTGITHPHKVPYMTFLAFMLHMVTSCICLLPQALHTHTKYNT